MCRPYFEVCGFCIWLCSSKCVECFKKFETRETNEINQKRTNDYTIKDNATKDNTLAIQVSSSIKQYNDEITLNNFIVEDKLFNKKCNKNSSKVVPIILYPIKETMNDSINDSINESMNESINYRPTTPYQNPSSKCIGDIK